MSISNLDTAYFRLYQLYRSENDLKTEDKVDSCKKRVRNKRRYQRCIMKDPVVLITFTYDGLNRINTSGCWPKRHKLVTWICTQQ